MAKHEKPHLNQGEEAFRKYVKQEKQKQDPSYTGENPNTPEEIKADLEKLKLEKEALADPEKRRELIAQGAAEVEVLEEATLQARENLGVEDLKAEELKPAREGGLTFKEYRQAKERFPLTEKSIERKLHKAFQESAATPVREIPEPQTEIRPPDFKALEEDILRSFEALRGMITTAQDEGKIKRILDHYENLKQEVKTIFGTLEEPKSEELAAQEGLLNILQALERFEPEFNSLVEEARQRAAEIKTPPEPAPAPEIEAQGERKESRRRKDKGRLRIKKERARMSEAEGPREAPPRAEPQRAARSPQRPPQPPKQGPGREKIRAERTSEKLRPEQVRQLKQTLEQISMGLQAENIEEQVARFSEIWQQLKEHYQGLVERTKDEDFRAHYTQALERLGADRQKFFWQAEKLKTSEKKPETAGDTEIRKSRVYQALEKEFLRGITLDRLQAYYQKAEDKAAVKQFVADVEAGYNPLARLAGEITLNFVDNWEQLNAATQKEAEKKLVKVSREVWRDFVYGARFDAKTGTPKPIMQQDIDARVSLWLLKKAGFKHVKGARPVKPGTKEAGAFHIDTSGQSGAFAEYPASFDKTKPLVYQIGKEPRERATVGTDNHPVWRERMLNSSAKVLYELLEHGGFLEGFEARDRSAIKMMVDYSVDTDNASLPVSGAGRLADFEKSARTLHGLGHYLTTDNLFRYFRDYSSQKESYKDVYREAVVEHELSNEELKRYGLDRPISGKRTATELVQGAINQAREYLGKKPEELRELGRVVDSRLGRYVVNIVRKPTDRLIAGHKVVQAYGGEKENEYDGYLNFDVLNQSLLVNTLNDRLDLSKDPKLQQLAQKAGAVTVRGVMIIKLADGSPLKVTLREILNTLGVKELNGQLKEALELEAKGELKPIEVAGEVRKKEKQAKRPAAAREPAVEQPALVVEKPQAPEIRAKTFYPEGIREKKAAAKPIERVEDDPRYQKLLEEMSFEYLLTQDRAYFEQNYSGVAPSGYLLDAEGKETNFLPSQNIGKDFEKVQQATWQEFLRRYPEDAKEYIAKERERLEAAMPERRAEEKKVPEKTEAEKLRDRVTMLWEKKYRATHTHIAKEKLDKIIELIRDDEVPVILEEYEKSRRK